MDSTELKAFLTTLAEMRGVSHFGWAPLEKPFSFDLYREWIARGAHGEMNYLEDSLPIKERPQTHYPFARSALIFAFPYSPHPRGPVPLKGPRVAKYAHGKDYHHWLKGELNRLIDDLRAKYPGVEFQAVTDTAPIMERDIAARAGLGWVGKNTCVIHPKKGSLFLLGEILCSAELAPSNEEMRDFCGKCNRCIEICPTQAITSPRHLDARLCISYWTVESRQIPSPELRGKFGDWFFGCDACQDVCPWNRKFFGELPLENPLTLDGGGLAELENELRWILESSGNQIDKRFKGTPMARAGSFGLRRNALIVVANRQMSSLRDLAEKWTTDERLGELARWSLAKLGSEI